MNTVRLVKTLLVASLLAFSVAISSAYSQTPAQRPGIKVLGVRVKGTITADPGLIIANSGLVVGKIVVGEDIQKAIRRIWALNLFRNVDILLEREVSGGGYFLIEVSEYPRLEEYEFSGNKKIKDDEIDDLLSLYKGQVIRPARLLKTNKKLLDTYHEKGYLLAVVDIEMLDTEDPMRKTLNIRIKEGKKVRIKKIHFEGNASFKDRTLRKRLKKTKQRGFLRSGSFDRDLYEEDLDLVIAFYRNNGYRDAEILGDSTTYTENRKRMILTIFIEEGTKYHFGDVTFEGNSLFDDDELMSNIIFKPGDVFNEEKLTLTYAERLGNLYYEKGYIYSRIEPIVLPVGVDTLDIHFSIIEGNQFRVRKINVVGNNLTKEKVIRREFVLYPGETFDVSKLRRSIRELTILNFFGNIVPDVQSVSEDEVDLYIQVEEKPTNQANMSVGYSERDGVIGAIGFAVPNLFGNGQRLSLDWNFGRIYRNFSISFIEPWMFNTPTLAGVTFFDLRRGGLYYGFDEHVTGGSLRLGRRFKWPDDYTRGDWIYKFERAIYSNFSDAFSQSNPRGLREGDPRYSSSVTQIFTRDSRDNPEFPSMGSVHSYSVELAGSIFGGDDQYHKHFINSEWYMPLTSKLVILSRTRCGLLFGLTGAPENIPYIDYFFMGGSGISFGESLRGYQERSVGPQTSIGGYAVGGQSLFKQTFELRIPVIMSPTVFVLTFAEAGNTWLAREETDFNDLKRSLGLGVRLFMPFIGLIGLDYGYGFDYIDSDGRRKGRWVPHFQFGRAF